MPLRLDEAGQVIGGKAEAGNVYRLLHDMFRKALGASREGSRKSARECVIEPKVARRDRLLTGARIGALLRALDTAEACAVCFRSPLLPWSSGPKDRQRSSAAVPQPPLPQRAVARLRDWPRLRREALSPLSGALRLLQPAQLRFRAFHRPTVGPPSQGLVDLRAVDRVTNDQVAIEPRAVLPACMLPVSNATRGLERFPHIWAAFVPSQSLEIK